jgi:hypothetical protein
LDKKPTSPPIDTRSDLQKAIDDGRRYLEMADAVQKTFGAALDLLCEFCFPGPSDLVRAGIEYLSGNTERAGEILSRSFQDPLGVAPPEWVWY